MTDWDSMVDYIHAAMSAVDNAHAATESLREKTDREALEKFQAEMKKLQKRLEQMQAILDHEDTYTMDELADALGATMGAGTTYHRIPHYEV
jgi:prefoldin subunit 5